MLQWRHAWRGSRGGTPSNRLGRQIERRKINENEIQHGLRWLPINEIVHNNQPKTGGRDGGDYGGEAQRAGGAGKRDIIVFGRGRSQRIVKN